MSSSTPDRPNEFSPTWLAAGVGMLLLAIFTPLTIHLTGAISALSPAQASMTPKQRIQLTAKPGDHGNRLPDRIAGALIEPGKGIGEIALGTRLDTSALPATMMAFFTAGPKGVRRHNGFPVGPGTLTISSTVADSKITELSLYVDDCRRLQRDQPRQDGLPMTADALTLGSHATRVGRHPRDGLRFSFCPENGLVRAITVHPVPEREEAPLVAQALPEAAAPRFPATETAISDAGVMLVAASFAVDTADVPQGFSNPQPIAKQVISAGQRWNPMQTAGAQSAPAPAGGLLPHPSVTLSVAPDLRTDVGLSDTTLPGRSPMLSAVDANVLIARPEIPAARFGELPYPAVAMTPAEREEALALGRSARRQIQRRLSLLGLDTAGVDGIFGPRTREAIAAFQRSVAMTETSYLNAPLIALLESQTDAEYASWQRAAREYRNRSATLHAAQVPMPRKAAGCRRDARGMIADNQSFSCDWALLEESLSALFNG